jgi:small subunit ribosomal protein S17
MAESQRPRRKTREGRVISDSMQKTVVVAVERRVAHPVYRRIATRTTKHKAHDEESTCRVGDRVRIMETRPLSAGKCWRVIEILERAQ